MRHSLSALSSLGGPLRRRAALRRRMGLSGLNEAHPMLVRGFKDGNNSWIDVMPSRLSPAMRITHTIGADLRKPPSFAGFAGLSDPAWGGPPWASGQAPAKRPRNVKCIQSGVGNAFCWNTETGESYWPNNPYPPKKRAPKEGPGGGAAIRDAAERAAYQERMRIREELEAQSVALKKAGLLGISCRSSGAGRVFCWNDEDMSVGARLYVKPGMEGLMGLSAVKKKLTPRQKHQKARKAALKRLRAMASRKHIFALGKSRASR